MWTNTQTVWDRHKKNTTNCCCILVPVGRCSDVLARTHSIMNSECYGHVLSKVHKLKVLIINIDRTLSHIIVSHHIVSTYSKTINTNNTLVALLWTRVLPPKRGDEDRQKKRTCVLLSLKSVSTPEVFTFTRQASTAVMLNADTGGAVAGCKCILSGLYRAVFY